MQTLLRSTRAYDLLRAEGGKNRFGHAYLLLFDDARNLRGALKTFAKLFFNAENGGRISDLIDSENFSDCLFYPEEGEKFKVEDAERLAEECTLRPVEGDKKVFVVSDFAEANASSQNKLLKLLEEPPQGVIFLLGATTSYPVLPTVLSRVEKLEIPSFDVPQLSLSLARIYSKESGYRNSDYELCAAASAGSLGRAQDILEGGSFRVLLNAALDLCGAEKSDLPVLVKKIGETKNKKELLSLLRIVFRDMTILNAHLSPSNLFLKTEIESLKKLSSRYEKSTLLYAQKKLSEAELQVQFNTVFPQCLEILFSKIIKRKEQQGKI